MRSAAVGLRSLDIVVGRVPHDARRGGALVAPQQRVQARLVADQQEARRRVALGGDVKAVHHDVGRAIAAHRIDREGVGHTGVRLGHGRARRDGPAGYANRAGNRGWVMRSSATGPGQARTALFSALPAATTSRPS